MLDTNIQVKTDNFDGPLALLLLLIQKEEMNVRELDLTVITKQYLAYLAQMREVNFDIAGDYLYLASTLLLLKSKTCIEEEETARLQEQIGGSELHITGHAELVRRLEELQHFQKMGQKLWALPKKGHEVFIKPKVNRKEIVNSILTPMDLEKLTTSMMDYLHKQKKKYTIVRRDRLSIKEKLNFLKTNLVKGQKTTFEAILAQDGEKDSIDNIVITFISLLELARLKRLAIFQNDPKGEIYLEVTKSLIDFDVNSAKGFEDEEELAATETKEMDRALEESITQQAATEEAVASEVPHILQ
jgi:segregation and condensation protein A